MKQFLGINLMMGIKRVSSFKDCWSSNFQLRDNYISKVMSLKRFSFLLGNFHVNDNSKIPKKGQPNYDKLYKVRPLLNKLSETFSLYYNPTEHQSIDESMIRFKGRSTLKQYMPKKTIKRGYKIWERADANGYVAEFQIYTGKVENVVETDLGARVILDLTKKLIGKNYSVVFDNYFSSTTLMHKLMLRKVKACATTQYKRKLFPKKMKNLKKMEVGKFKWRSSRTGLTAVVWQDKRPIPFLSNYLDPTKLESVSRKQKDGTKKVVSCPPVVRIYNQHMGYVDKGDQLKKSYEINRKSKKWWHRIFFHFLDLVVVNSWILFFSLFNESEKVMKLKDFRLCIASSLIGSQNPHYKLNSENFSDFCITEQNQNVVV